MKRELTCIVCPVGCRITVDTERNSISGNTCAKGREYAFNECTDPKRVVTTTARCSNGGVVAVKTDRPIPKAKMFECMKIINNINLRLPVSVGDIIIEDVFGSNVVAAQNMR